MMEYFTYKKVKKHQAEKKAKDGEQTPIISEEDEHFLTRVISTEGTPPPLPERPRFGPAAGDSMNNLAQMVVHDGNGTTEPAGNDTTKLAVEKQENKQKHKGKGKENEKHDDKKASRFSFLARSLTKMVSSCPGPNFSIQLTAPEKRRPHPQTSRNTRRNHERRRRHNPRPQRPQPGRC
jgi:hypothetical protein